MFLHFMYLFIIYKHVFIPSFIFLLLNVFIYLFIYTFSYY